MHKKAFLLLLIALVAMACNQGNSASLENHTDEPWTDTTMADTPKTMEEKYAPLD